MEQQERDGVTSADIRQMKMNYLQHNKNALPKHLENATASQVALH